MQEPTTNFQGMKFSTEAQKYWNSDCDWITFKWLLSLDSYTNFLLC